MIVQSLWIGELSDLERLAINSHLVNGHEYHLYSYGYIRAPKGTIVMDAAEILPENRVFTYQVGPGRGSVSAFSNLFRYKLLYERGGWWVDTDIVCLKPFQFDTEYVFGSERTKENTHHPATCVMKCPPRAAVMEFCVRFCEKIDQSRLEWGTIGPRLLKRSVDLLSLHNFVVPSETFCPVDWYNTDMLFQNTSVDSCGLHLWNEMWRRKGYDKNGKYPETLYGRLRNDFLPQ